jgi:hypothetical protein
MDIDEKGGKVYNKQSSNLDNVRLSDLGVHFEIMDLYTKDFINDSARKQFS